MTFGHEKLDVYQVSLRYNAWVFTYCDTLTGTHRHGRDQLIRASQSIPLNIAEGNGKGSLADRRRYFEIARGSALECAAIQDVLTIRKALTKEQNEEGKAMLDRIAAMLSKLGGRTGTVREDEPFYYTDSRNDN